MNKNIAVLLLLISTGPDHVQADDKCADVSEQGLTAHPCAEVAPSAGDPRTKLPETELQDSTTSTIKITTDLLTGQWVYQSTDLGLNYSMTIHDDGRYEGSGSNAEGAFRSEGLWSLVGRVLITDVTVVTTMKDGSTSTKTAISKSKIQTLSRSNLTVLSAHSDTAVQWHR